MSSVRRRVGKSRSGSRRRAALFVALGLLGPAAACGSTGSLAPGGSHVTGGSSTTAGSSTPATSAQPPGSTTSTTAQPTTTSCTLPLTHDAYSGFHIAVPPGWDLSTLNSQVEDESTTAATEAVIVIPALETGGLTPSSFFNLSLQNLEKETKGAGGTIEITARTGLRGSNPAASFTAHAGGADLQGDASVEVIPLQTKLAGAEVVFSAYWAPASHFSTDEHTLSSIVRCYGPEKATLFQVFQNQAFTYIMPPGWTVDALNQNGIILNLGSTADVTYLLAEVVPASEAGSGEGLIRYYLNTAGVVDVHSLWTDSSPTETVSSGAEQQTTFEEFTGSIKGVADHGLIYSVADTGSDGLTSGVIRMALSTQSTWNSLNSGLIQMAGSIQHNFTQDLEQLQNINQEWQNFSGQVESFDDVLNQQQLVQDPTTGTYYEAPYSSYETDGPDGAGYYTSSGQALNPVNNP
jgi:hypothetical protein